MSNDFRDYYTTLGVKKEASAEEIKQAYRRLAKQHHPDLQADKDKVKATDKFAEINEAYAVLSDPSKKSKYDQVGYAGPINGDSNRTSGRGDAPRQYRTEQNGDSFEGFSDFFESMYGNAGGQGFGRNERPRGGPRKGPDIEAELPLSLEDSVRGGDTKFSIQAPVHCPVCHGSGRQGNSFCPNCAGVGEIKQERAITAHLPKHARNGMKLRLRGQGGPSSNGGEPGDLFLRIRLLPHPIYKVLGDDLETNVTLMPWEASLGGEISVPTLAGPIRIRVPAETHSGRRLRIAGKGLGKEDSSSGDLYAVVQIDIPAKTTDSMKRLYQELREAGT